MRKTLLHTLLTICLATMGGWQAAFAADEEMQEERLLRFVMKNGMHKDFLVNEIDSMTSTTTTQTIWYDGFPTELTLTAIDSVLFLSNYERYVPTQSYRGYQDAGEDYLVEMNENAIYVREDLGKDLIEYDAEAQTLTFAGSERLEALDIKVGDILYSVERTEQFPDGYCFEVTGITELRESGRRIPKRLGEVDLPEKVIVEIREASLAEAFIQIHEYASVGAGSVASMNIPEHLSSDLQSRFRHHVWGEEDHPFWEEKDNELELNFARWIDGRTNKDENGNKYEFKLLYDNEGKGDICGWEIKADKHKITYKDKYNENGKMTLNYELTLKELKESHTKFILGADLTFGYEIWLDLENLLFPSKAKVDIAGYIDYGATAYFKIKQDEFEDIIDWENDVINNFLKDKQDLKDYLKGKKMIHLNCLPIPLPYGLNTVVNPGIGLNANFEFKSDGSFKVSMGYKDGKLGYLFSNQTAGSWALRTPILWTENEAKPVFNLEGKLHTGIDWFAGVGLDLEIPKLKHGKDKRVSYVGVYFGPRLQGTIDTNVTYDDASHMAQTNVKLKDASVGFVMRGAYDAGYKQNFELCGNWDHELANWGKIDDYELNWSTSLHDYNNYFLCVPAFNSHLTKNDIVKFQWNGAVISTNKVEIYLGKSDKKSAMSKIGTLENDDEIEAMTFTHTHLEPGTYYWFVRAYGTSGAYIDSDISHFVVDGVVADEWIDLGLPSGTLWATCNLGATKATEVGNYYAWAEKSGYKEGKHNFDWKNYKYCKGSHSTLTKYCSQHQYGNDGYVDMLYSLQEDDDVCLSLGDGWSMPTKYDWAELLTECTWTQFRIGDVFVARVEGKNGQVLFLPAGGYRSASGLYDYNTDGHYWSADLDLVSPDDAWFIYFGNSGVESMGYHRCIGRNVRPVKHMQFSAPRRADAQNETKTDAVVEKQMQNGSVVKCITRSALTNE